MQPLKFSRFTVLPAIVSLVVALGSATAQDQATPMGPSDPAELEAWLDGAMAAQLEAYHSAGAVVSVVVGGEPFFSKGYGYADVEARVKVDPATTLFRIASVSKLFIWTAVMQLVEQGRLDLQADVNTYLKDVKVPRKFGGPVTMTNLLSHTAGFEDYVLGLFGRDESSLATLREILRRELPRRVRRAGEFASYSNHGAGLAMLVVEDITGTPWLNYIQENILDPLNMSEITFEQPVPDNLAPHLSKGYRFLNRVYKEQDFEYVPMGPVGGGSASAAAMAKFMIAHLQLGRLGEARILEEETARLMQSELHRMAPDVNAMAHGFIEMNRNGQRIIGHGGDTLWFHSMLALLPEHNVGIFVSYNTAGGAQGAGALIKQFVDRYFPVDDPPPVTPRADFDRRAQKYAGTYRANRYSHSTITKLGVALDPVRVRPSGDGALLLSSSGDKRWIEIAPLTFRDEYSYDTVVFVEDRKGGIRRLLMGDVPIIAFDREGFFDTPDLHAAILGVSMLCFAFTILLWPAGAVLRWKYDVLLSSHHAFPFAARACTWVSSLLFVLFVGGIAVLFEDRNEVVFGPPQSLDRLLWLPMAACALVLIESGYSYYVWWAGQGRVRSRIYYTAVTLVSLVFLWQLFYWNLLGHQYLPGTGIF